MKQHPSIFQYVFVPAMCLVLLLGRASAAPAHPHLFYTASEVASLRARISDPFYANSYNEILIDCRSTYSPSDPIPNSSRINNGQAIISHGALLLLEPTGRAIQDRYQSNKLFFSYFDAVLNMSGWSDFFGNTPFDSSFLLISLCIGYDMHYDKFTSTQRADIVNKLAARADYLVNNASEFFEVPADLSNPSWEYLHVFKILRNRTMIPIGALGMIAYTLEGEVNETRRQTWLAKVDELLGVWNQYVSPDGISHEGYSYHEYLMRSLFPMLHARSRRTGVNQFTLIPYIKQYALASIYSWVPGGDRSFIQPIPFGDCDTEPPAPLPTHAALAARMLKGASDESDHLANWMQYRAMGQLANNAYNRVDPLQFFWADSSITMRSPDELKLPHFRYFPNRGLFVWRSGWDDMATYFAMTCGPTIGGHQHPEMGNFVIHKGGAPFVAHHGYNKTRRTEANNLMIINSQGQWGDRFEDGEGTTQPQPSSRWASITKVIADDDYFDVLTNLKPIYRDTTIQGYTREFVQAAGVFFVLDRLSMATGVTGSFQNIVNAYATTQPVYDINTFKVLDIDSNMTANPWTGSGRTHQIKPRQSGPFTGSMTVQDLSPESWTATVVKSNVNNADNQFVGRGYRLLLSRSDNATDLLMAYYFPQTGRSVSAWPNANVGSGFMIKSGSAVQALGVWSNTGAVNNSSGLTLAGEMGGLDLTANSMWGRNVTKLQYNSRTYISSTVPVSLFCALTATGERIRLQSNAAASVSIYLPTRPTAVKLNKSTLSQSSWSWSNQTLKLTLSAQSSQALIEATWPKNAVPESDWALYR